LRYLHFGTKNANSHDKDGGIASPYQEVRIPFNIKFVLERKEIGQRWSTYNVERNIKGE